MARRGLMAESPEQDSYQKIKKLFDEKKFDEIIRYCQKLLVEDSKNKVALQNISTAYNIVGGYQDAIETADKMLKIDRTDEFALKNKMFAYEQLQNNDEVLKCCEQILEKNTGDVDTLIGKGIALSKTGKHDSAISIYKKVLNIDTRNLDALMNLAITYNYLQKYQEAITYYDMIQEVTLNFSNVQLEKSKAFEALGKIDDAFLAAQGIRLHEAETIKADAKLKNYSVQHAFELKRFHELTKMKNDDSD